MVGVRRLLRMMLFATFGFVGDMWSFLVSWAGSLFWEDGG